MVLSHISFALFVSKNKLTYLVITSLAFHDLGTGFSLTASFYLNLEWLYSLRSYVSS